MRIFLAAQLRLREVGRWLVGWLVSWTPCERQTNQPPTHLSAFLIATVLAFLLLAGQVADQPGTPVVYAETVPPVPTPAWRIDPNQNNMAVLIVDYAGSTVKEAYFLQEPACQSALPAATLTLNARTALSGTITGDQLALALEAGSRLPERMSWSGPFFAWSLHLGDFTAQALLTPCLGQPLFAGESIWMGHGVRPFPHHPLPATALTRLPTRLPPPATLATVAQTEWMTITAAMAWSAIADLNLLHDMAQQPYATHTFLYRPATGYVDPRKELAHAEWVFIIYHELPLRTQRPIAQFLPLICQH